MAIVVEGSIYTAVSYVIIYFSVDVMHVFLYLCVDLAQAVVDAGAVPLLVLCVQEPEISVKRIAASALSDIAKHSPEVSRDITRTIFV